MADTKISALPAASTPLTGSEVVPLNQSGVTSNVTVANLTAGRNVYANNFIPSVTITAASATPINLTVNSTQYQTVNGTTTSQQFNLPDATTLSVGDTYYFNNNITVSSVQVNAHDGSTSVLSLQAGGDAQVVLLNNSTTNGTWDVHSFIPSSASWGTATLSFNNTTSISGSVSWTGTKIGTAYGGTGQTSYAVGDLLYADTTTTLAKLSDVATGNALISGGVSTAPSWGKIGLTTHVSGTLPIANGGTNMTIAPPMFAAYSSSTQNPTSGTATKVIFGTTSFDTNSNFASSRFTATIAGYYQFSACVSCAADTLVTFILLQFYKNGSQQVNIVGTNSYGTQNTTSPQTLSTSSLIYLAATDYVEVYATVTGTGGNRYIFLSNVNYPTVFNGALIR